MISQVSLYSNAFYLLTSCLCHTTELLFALNAAESAAAQVGGYASCSAATERIEHPVALIRACQYNACQQRERFLRWVLAARLLPSPDGRQSPHVGHLFPVVQPFHHVVVEFMRHLLRFPRPYHKLSGIGEEPARDVHWRIGLLPCDDVENPVAELRQAVSHRKDIMICARNPYRTVLLQFLPAHPEPLHIPLPHFLGSLTLVPFPLVHAHHLSALQGYSAVGEEIRRVGEYHVKLKVEIVEKTKRVAIGDKEVRIWRCIV